jgi:hypothetical protein
LCPCPKEEEKDNDEWFLLSFSLGSGGPNLSATVGVEAKKLSPQK